MPAKKLLERGLHTGGFFINNSFHQAVLLFSKVAGFFIINKPSPGDKKKTGFEGCLHSRFVISV
jgi:hypothetical protein